MQKRFKAIDIIGPVLICYAFGLLLGNLPGVEWPEKFLNDSVNSITVVLAIPLLMFASNPKTWRNAAGKTLLSFFLGAVAVGVVVSLTYLTMHTSIKGSREMAAMLIGVYTGGTPNLIAIGSVLEVGVEVTPKLIMMDTLICAFYLLFLLTLANRLLSTFLKPGATVLANDESNQPQKEPMGLKTGLALLLSAACFGAGVGLSLLLTGGLDALTILLTVTILGFLLSFLKPVNQMPGSYQLGELLILMFCVSIGLLSNFSALISQSSTLLLFCATIVGGSILLHYVLAYFFKIDTHTVLITSTAALFGPAFVGLIASRLKNPALVSPGMTAGVVGYSIANIYALSIYQLLGFI
mgnify:FL=1